MKTFFSFAGGLVLVALAAYGCEAIAQTPCPTGTVAPNAALVCWTNATQFTDGSPIPATGPNALEATQIARGKCGATGQPDLIEQVADVPASVGSSLFDGLALGWQCFRTRHKTNTGQFSNWSAFVRKELKPLPPPADKPRPPTTTVR